MAFFTILSSLSFFSLLILLFINQKRKSFLNDNIGLGAEYAFICMVLSLSVSIFGKTADALVVSMVVFTLISFFKMVKRVFVDKGSFAIWFYKAIACNLTGLIVGSQGYEDMIGTDHIGIASFLMIIQYLVVLYLAGVWNVDLLKKYFIKCVCIIILMSGLIYLQTERTVFDFVLIGLLIGMSIFFPTFRYFQKPNQLLRST